MGEEDLGGLQAKLLADARGVGVADLPAPRLRQAGLVGVPAVGFAPGVQLGPLRLGQALLPLRLHLVVAPGERRRWGEGPVECPGNGAAVGVGLVAVTGTRPVERLCGGRGERECRTYGGRG